MSAYIRALEYYLPEKILTNVELSQQFPQWSVADIEIKTGIVERHITATDEYASDLAVNAVKKLFDSGVCKPQEIDFILYCTQSPDYLLPTTACLLQDRLGIPTTAGALDFNLGCSGYIYGLSLAKGLIETRQAKNVLLITSDTYSKFISSNDRSVRTLFGDAAAATLISTSDKKEEVIGPFVFGTDGRGGKNLQVAGSGMRGSQESPGENHLYMDGPEIFNFSIESVPATVKKLLDESKLLPENIDLFIFHQANRYMLEHLRKKMSIPEEKFYLFLKECGNTVSSTIPIALKQAVIEGVLKKESLVMLVGFGVGYSWGATLIRYNRIAEKY
jgi:3-oxoacyl-[acyl-carrier-protein] synthase III